MARPLGNQRIRARLPRPLVARHSHMTTIKHAIDDHYDHGWMRQLRPSELTVWWERVPLRSDAVHKDAVLAAIIAERTN